ncbi:polygalacturonase 1 beta-like protein 2 isoform X1 [Primulina tabacum]|uniref:polygalacturonase 1 beta-like protein 2 isoform X1 n=1 Tax=Primulina tabacum TaxID=48773 RepID=UPI003F59B230
MKMCRRRFELNCDISFIFSLLLLVSFLYVSFAETNSNTRTKENPFTPKASLIRYWSEHVCNNDTKPSFLLSKASPLTAVESAFYTKLAAQKTLSSHLPAFCSAANLFCLLDSKHTGPENLKNNDVDFTFYTNKQFEKYGNSRVGGVDQFKNYSGGINIATGSFTRYSRSSTGHDESFASYANDGNVASSNFTSYGSSATGGSGEFINYMPRVNVPNLHFALYDSEGNSHNLSFSRYVDNTNAGNQGFTTYGKNGNAVPVEFSSYGDTSNVVGSRFTSYGELGNAGNDSFKGYSSNSNNPSNNFKNYGAGSNGGADTFTSYRDSANAGTDTFQSYGRESSSGNTSFSNYGKSFNVGFDTFTEYAKKGFDQSTGFKIYGVNSTFQDYARKGVKFAQYVNPGSSNKDHLTKVSVKVVNNGVEEGKFFREGMLKEGALMKMPEFRDRMPRRSFLPRTITSKLPFSTYDLLELKRTFLLEENSTMERMVKNTLLECERAPSPGETKRCVASIEDMIDFATTILGDNVVVRTTKDVKGSNQYVIIGVVNGINGGRSTESVSCHQSLYPYLLYYCHSVPNVRVYEAGILDVETKAKINDGVAICHLDTSAWSPNHGAFLALGSSPGRVEVCHWIFENDMTWARGD